MNELNLQIKDKKIKNFPEGSRSMHGIDRDFDRNASDPIFCFCPFTFF